MRLDAAKQLVVQLQATQAASADAETMCEDVRYTFERCVGSLGEVFAAALTSSLGAG